MTATQTQEAPTVERNRPVRFAEVVGQGATLDRLRIVLAGAKARGVKPPHILLDGPAGTGKTTLARSVAAEMGCELVAASAPSLARPGDVAGLLTSAPAGAVVFLDEIHRLPAKVAETLYEALEDGRLSIMVGSGPAARAVTLSLPPFVCIGATTMPGKLPAPLRDRFGVHLTMQPYSDDELAEIAGRVWDRAGVAHDGPAAAVVGSCAKGTPRLAVHLAQRVLDVAATTETASITAALARRALARFGVGARGLDEIDLRILDALTVTFAGRAVGLNNLASALDLDERTIESQHEPALVRAGLVVRTPQGRIATQEGYERARRPS